MPMRPIKTTLTVTLIAAIGLSACGRKAKRASNAEHECMMRAMDFESNRSSRDGMIAVGSVVMNRVDSSDFPNSVCAVVSQKNQFAPGVMTKPMTDSGRPLAEASARAVLRGERHPRVRNARFFHAAWYKANFNNIHYVVTTGGNAFYEKRRPENVTKRTPYPNTEGVTR